MSSTRVKSLAVGLSSAGIDLLLFSLCTLFWAGGLALALARWCCAAASAGLNFLGNRHWAFGASADRARRQLSRFVAAAAGGVCLTTGLWYAIYRLTALDPRIAHLISLALVWALYSYPVLRGWVFRRARSSLNHA